MKRGRPILVILLVVAILATAATRYLAVNERQKRVTRVVGGTSSESLSRMGSFALALLLGGLRGPLAMILWSSSESQKNERNLEDIDTKIELIRLLQAEFDSVHLFQIWNKGYNLSVQMANLPNKYATILDAVDYGVNALRDKPDNINLTFAIGDLLFSKLGDSAEKVYYQARVREETLPPEPMVKITFPAARRSDLLAAARAAGLDSLRVPIRIDSEQGDLSTTLRKTYADRIQQRFSGEGVGFEPREARTAAPAGPGVVRTRHDSILGEDFRVLPELIEPARPRPADLPEGERWNTAAELQYFTDFRNPDGSLWQFPYGVSPLTLGYNYFRRAEFQQTVNEQRHLQLGAKVVSARPGLALYKWAEEEWRRGRRKETEALLDQELPSIDDLEREPMTANFSLDRPVATTPLIEEAIFSYERVADITEIARQRYVEHIRRYVEDEQMYQSHFDWLAALAAKTTADATYLRALTAADPAERVRLAKQAREEYRRAIDLLTIPLFRFYLLDSVIAEVFPPGRNDPLKKNEIVRSMAFPERLETLRRARERFATGQFEYEVTDEFTEYNVYIERAEARMRTIDAFLASAATMPTTALPTP